jgi:hypothetical protein
MAGIANISFKALRPQKIIGLSKQLKFFKNKFWCLTLVIECQTPFIGQLVVMLRCTGVSLTGGTSQEINNNKGEENDYGIPNYAPRC